MNFARALGFVVIAGLATTAAAEELLPDVNCDCFTPNLYNENGFNYFYDSDDAFWDSNPYYAPYYDYYDSVLIFAVWT
jgi:hypothetical protein